MDLRLESHILRQRLLRTKRPRKHLPYKLTNWKKRNATIGRCLTLLQLHQDTLVKSSNDARTSFAITQEGTVLPGQKDPAR